MIKRLIIVICTIAFTIQLKAQVSTGVYSDATISKKYAKDTVGFKPYPNTFLFNNIKPAQKFVNLEINSAWPACKNLYRYPFQEERYAANDTVVLSKIGPLSKATAFFTTGDMAWYISVKYKSNNIVSIGNTVQIKALLGKIANEYNAYLWVQVNYIFGFHFDEPIKTSPGFLYKKVKNGYLITCRAPTPGQPQGSFADLTYFVGEDFRISLVSTRNLSLPKKGDLIYKI